jgi:NitT/TauT family transport system permease protein
MTGHQPVPPVLLQERPQVPQDSGRRDPDRDGVPQRPGRGRRARDLWMGAVPPLLVFVVVLGGWTAFSYWALSPRRRFLLPPPIQVLRVGLLDRRNRDELLAGLLSSAKVAVIGLAIAIVIGTALAVLMSRARWIERSAYPWAVVLQTIPILALVPLIGFWFGYGLSSRVLVCVMIALFPIITNTLFGLQSADTNHLDLFRMQRAGRLTTLRKLLLPGAMPAILTGWRTSAGLSVMGAIVGDFFFRQGEAGIGRLLDGYTQRLQSEQLFAGVLLASLFGLVVFWAFGLLSWLVVGGWHESGGRRG